MHRGSLILSICLACSSGAKPENQASGRPNVIIILADDLGYGDVGSYGNMAFTTPNLDGMAAEGVRFTDFYVPVPYCAPSRATLLTGRYPFRTGVVFNPSPDSGVNDVGIPSQELTLGEAFQQAGYATSCIGKWHLGHKPEFYPRQNGFDEYYGILYSNDMRPVQLIENEMVVEYPVVQATLTQRYTQRALDFVERNKNRSFFLYLAHAMPHKPLAASEKFYKTSPSGLYGDVIAELDWSVGEILGKLRELDMEERTLVIFTSDNGPWYGGSTGGLRGMKSRTWDGGIRVPMIARWPGKIPTGFVSHEAAGIVDLFPTVTRLADVDTSASKPLDGVNIWPWMVSRPDGSPHEALVAMQGPNLAIVRSGKWKLHVRSPGEIPERGEDWIDPRGPDGVTILAPFEQAHPRDYPGVLGGAPPKAMMLFDLQADPAEQDNVALQYPDIVGQLKARFDEFNAQVPDFSRPPRTPLQRPGPRPEVIP